MTDKKKQISEEAKNHIINLHIRKYTINSISDIYQVSKRTIQRIIKRHKTTNNVERIKGSGRKANQFKMNLTKKIIENDNNLSVNDVSRILLDQHNIKYSKSAVYKCLKKSNFVNKIPILKPLLTEEHINCRENWAIFYQNYNWDNVIWSDECNISIQSNKKSKIWINKNKKVPIKRVVKYPINIHIWGCILKNNKLIISIYEKTMSSSKYIDVLKENLLPLINSKNDRKLLFQQDNAPCHTSFSTINFFSENKIEVMYWPPNSPDLNPIENLWNLLKKRIGKIIVKNKDELINAIKTEADKIDVIVINKLIDSMDNRIEQLFNKSFDSIDY
jgi:transposase